MSEPPAPSLLDLGAESIAGAPALLLPALGLAAAGMALIGLPLLAVEAIRLRRRGELTRRRLAGMATSAFCALPATLVQALFGGALMAVFLAASALAPWSIPTGWATALLCFVAVDFFYYWEHRLGHRVNALWSLYHSVHHSADHFDQTIGLRISFVDFFFAPLIYLPLVLAGFHPLLVFACFGVVLAWQQWIHTELVGKLPLLDPWLNTPANHRVHHGRNDIYLDRNYGGVLILWDRLFGTYAPESETVDYGLVEQLKSRNPLAVHFAGFARLFAALGRARSASDALKAAFGPPEAQRGEAAKPAE